MGIHNISLRTIAAATEDEDRVKNALSLFLFDTEIEKEMTEGYFGNPISIFNARINGNNCDKFIELLKSKCCEKDMDQLKKELDDRIDDYCNFHIRFDKQAAYNGTVRLATTTDTISVRIKLKAYPARRDKALEVAEKIFKG